jgi:hypothetical protein
MGISANWCFYGISLLLGDYRSGTDGGGTAAAMVMARRCKRVMRVHACPGRASEEKAGAGAPVVDQRVYGYTSAHNASVGQHKPHRITDAPHW